MNPTMTYLVNDLRLRDLHAEAERGHVRARARRVRTAALATGLARAALTALAALAVRVCQP